MILKVASNNKDDEYNKTKHYDKVSHSLLIVDHYSIQGPSYVDVGLSNKVAKPPENPTMD